MIQPEEVRRVAEALDDAVVSSRTMAGGFSHETCLLTLADRRVVARLGGPDRAVEAGVMAVARQYVPVPRVLLVLPAATPDEGARPLMVLEHVEGSLLSEVLSGDEFDATDLGELGAEVGRVAAGIGAATFHRRGFFVDEQLTVSAEDPWSQQLPEFSKTCMTSVPEGRLGRATLRAWVDLCAAHAPALARIDGQARLVHADLNPKNVLVSRVHSGWRVDAVLDWEFSHSGCPYGDAANMARFGADYPAAFLSGFRTAFAGHRPTGLPLAEDWEYLGRVLDMFALSELVTRPPGHPVADQAAEQVRRWVTDGVPRW